MAATARNMLDKYHEHYATVKRRGVHDHDCQYTVTVHKRLVRRSGFEFAEDLPFTLGDMDVDTCADGPGSGSDTLFGIADGPDSDVNLDTAPGRAPANRPRHGSGVGHGSGSGHGSHAAPAPTRDTFNEDFSRFEESLSRSKSRIIQLVANNEWDWFVTFTLNKEKMYGYYGLSRYDLQGVKKHICAFMKKYRERHGLRDESGNRLFAYVLIPELHKDGAVHYHGVLRGVDTEDIDFNRLGHLAFMPMESRFGLTYLSPITATGGSSLARANYMSKYISKNMFNPGGGHPGDDSGDDVGNGGHVGNDGDNDAGGNDGGGMGFRGQDPGKNLYFCSKGLKRDQLLVKGEPAEDIAQYIDQTAAITPEGEIVPITSTLSNEWVYKVTCQDKAFALSLVRPYLRVRDIDTATGRKAFLRIPNPLTKRQKAASRRNRAREFLNDVLKHEDGLYDEQGRPLLNERFKLDTLDVWEALLSLYRQTGLYGEYVHGTRYELRDVKRKGKYDKQALNPWLVGKPPVDVPYFAKGVPDDFFAGEAVIPDEDWPDGWLVDVGDVNAVPAVGGLAPSGNAAGEGDNPRNSSQNA